MFTNNQQMINFINICRVSKVVSSLSDLLHTVNHALQLDVDFLVIGEVFVQYCPQPVNSAGQLVTLETRDHADGAVVVQHKTLTALWL